MTVTRTPRPTARRALVLVVALAMALSPVVGSVTGVGVASAPRASGSPAAVDAAGGVGAEVDASATAGKPIEAQIRIAGGGERVEARPAATGGGARTAPGPARAYSSSRTATDDLGIPDFEYAPDPATVGETVQFDGTPLESDVNGTIVNATYTWSFGDGTNATGPKPTHAYDSAGFATVTLSANFRTEDGTSHSMIAAQTLMVATSNPPNGEIAYSPDRPTLGETVQFDATATPVPDDATDVSYRWKIGLQRFEGPTPTYNITDSASSSIDFPVDLPVRMSVNFTTDSGTTTYVAERQMTIYEESSGDAVEWLTDVGEPANVTTGPGTANLTVGECGDAAAWKNYDAHDGSMTVSFDYRYSLETADQRPRVTVYAGVDSPSFLLGDAGSGSGQFERTVPVDGTPTVTLTLDEECVGAGDVYLDVRNFDVSLSNESLDEPPTAAFSYDPGDPSADVPVEFHADASDDGRVASREWDFDGDGTADATGADVSHTYASEGTYTVTLTVTDDAGQTETAQRAVSVAPPPSEQFDDDGDGLQGDELRDALNNVTGTTDGASGSDGTDANETGGVDVEEARSAIDDYISGPTGDPLANASENVTDTDGDGLSDALEENGIPVRQTYNTTDYQTAAFDNADVIGTTPEGYKLLDTSKFDADTDGDGIPDRKELGRAVFEANPDPRESGDLKYYTLKSDPTDANTDDAGVDDGEEYKKGTDPTSAEWFHVNAVLPVVGEEGCDVQTDTTVNNCARDVDGFEDTYAIKALAESNSDHGEKQWLSNVDASKLDDDSTYYLVQVSFNSKAEVFHTRHLPDSVTVSGFGLAEVVGQGESRDAIYDSDLVDPFGDGTETSETMYVAVRADTREGLYKLLGTMTMTMYLPADSPYARKNTAGRTEVTVTTESKFVVEDGLPLTSEQEARAMVEEASQKFAQNVVSAAFPVNAGGLSAASLSHLARPAFTTGTMLAAEGVAAFTGIGDAPSIGADDMAGKQIAGEGAVPAYLEPSGDSEPTANVAVTVYREN